ncbi:hypothetical protein E2320_005604 [Naja naja]|nr:hypothetical protein E2320_005604 [Naja naja]
MDKILEAILASSYPDHMKQGLVRRIIEALKRTIDTEQCWSMLELSTKLFLLGDTKFKRSVGKEILEVCGLYHQEAFQEFFNAQFLLSLLQEGYGPLGKRSLYVFDYIHLGLPFVMGGPSANDVFSLLRTEVLRKVCERPGLKQCVKISKLLIQYPLCVPTGKRQILFCQQLIRCIGQFHTTSGREDAVMEFLDQVIQVSLLLQKIWKTQMTSILPSLKELFTIISTIDKWIIALLKNLAAVKKFSILMEVTLSKIERLLPHIPRVVAALQKENSNSASRCLDQALPIPNEDRIKHLLGQNAWTSQRNELANLYPRLASKSETGKIGLPSASKTLVEEMFGGKIKTKIRCLKCLQVSSREEAFTDLSLAFPPADDHKAGLLSSALIGSGEERGPEISPSRIQTQSRLKDLPARTGILRAPEENASKHPPMEAVGSTFDETSLPLMSERDAVDVKATKESHLDLHKQISGCRSSRSVPDLINYFLSPEMLTAENRYHCENCASLQDAEKLTELTEGPHYLILTLLRFSFDLGTMRRKKILDNVSVPLILKLPVVVSPDQARTSGWASPCKDFSSVVYDLCSVVVHSGVSSESGHYYCYARECEESLCKDAIWNLASAKSTDVEIQWYIFNDTRVFFSSFESVSNVTSFLPKDTAYLLFYRQRATRASNGAGPEPGWTNGSLHSPDKNLMDAITKDNILFLQLCLNLPFGGKILTEMTTRMMKAPQGATAMTPVEEDRGPSMGWSFSPCVQSKRLTLQPTNIGTPSPQPCSLGSLTRIGGRE